jgi:cytochrome c biogenesis protein CcmG/thiol:disulfide interchange protein DsbE
MKLKNFFPAFLFLLVALLMAISTKLGDKANFYPSMIGKEMPAFEAPLLEGEGVLSSDEIKSNSIVNLWASWCVACQAEHENLLELAKTYKIYGINSGDSPVPAKKYLAEHGNPFYKVGVDPQRRIALALGAQGLPETYVIGDDGIIYFHHRGVLTKQVIEEELVPILKELEK